MTEKLTYDPTPADTTEFTEDEQDSIRVAEKLGEQESELLAGKYESTEQLEEAYLALQKKLGSDSNDEDTEVDTLEETEEEVSPGVSLITDASNEYYANEGKLSQETMDKFGEMSSQDLVNAYMEIQANNPNPQQELMKQAGQFASSPMMDPSKNQAMAESFLEQKDQLQNANQGQSPNTGEEETPA